MSAGIPRSTAEIARRAVSARLADVRAIEAGQVLDYDGQFATVDMMVKNPVFDDDGLISVYEDLGQLSGVPVMWPRFGGFYLAGPLVNGDEGVIFFSSSPWGEWRATGQKSEPKDASRHTLGYPAFFPALFNDGRALPDATARAAGVVLGKEGSDEQIRIASGSVQVGASGVQALPTQADYSAFLTALESFLAPTNWATISAAGSAAATLLTAVTTGAAKPAFTTLFKAK